MISILSCLKNHFRAQAAVTVPTRELSLLPLVVTVRKGQSPTSRLVFHPRPHIAVSTVA
jgi:hypothetical protein